jgi:hypothetical protein
VGLPPLLWSFPPTSTFTSFPAPDCWVCAAAPAGLSVCFQLMWEVGLSPLSCGAFLPSPLSQAFLLLVAGCMLLLPPSPARPNLFIYNSGRDSLPLSSVLMVSYPLSNVPLLFLLLITQFLFFPVWGSVCPGGCADLVQGCPWEYHVPLSLPCPHLPKPSVCGCLVVARGPSLFLHSI